MEDNNEPSIDQPPLQQNQQSTVTSSNSPKPKLPLFILITFIFLVLIGGGVYLIKISNLKNQNSNPQLKSQNLTPVPPSPTIAVDKTANLNQIRANWKTYTNNNFNFEFKYPNNFVVTDNLPAQKVTFTKATENLILSDQASSIELKFWFEPAGFGDIFADKIIDLDYSTDKGIYILEETIEDVKQYRDDDKTIIMNSAKPINNHTITITYSYQKEDENKEKLFKEILSTFKFTDE